ncbi:MAG: GLPGLI family protein [Niabella sp.]
MMKKIASFIVSLLLTAGIVHGQVSFKDYDVKCFYNLSFQPDSTDPGSKRIEAMVLLVNSKASLFMSYNSFLYDSSAYETFKKTGSAFGDMKSAMAFKTKIRYKIVKDNEKIFAYDKINDNSFVYEEALKNSSWKIQKDTSTIDGINCQKAILNYGGRQWIAWFAPSIPISDGPYKFRGLPGLIINISDKKDFYKFELTSIVNSKGQYLTPEKIDYVKISKEKYFKAADEYKKNQYEMDQLGGVKFTGGQEAIKKRLQEQAAKDNNPIEFWVK